MVHRKNVELRAELGAAHVLIEQLRQELGQASRELKACAETLDACRRERGEALDRLAVYEPADDTEGEELRAELDVFVMDSIPPAAAQKAFARQGFNALMQDLDDAIATMWGSSGITEMHTTAPMTPATNGEHTLLSVNDLPPPESGLEPLFPGMLGPDDMLGPPVLEDRDDLNDTDDFEATP